MKKIQQPVKEMELILFNDDVNSLPYVVACLIRFCGHGMLQAEQCALIAHYNGKCSIKVGSYTALLDLSFLLRNADLKVEIK